MKGIKPTFSKYNTISYKFSDTAYKAGSALGWVGAKHAESAGNELRKLRKKKLLLKNKVRIYELCMILKVIYYAKHQTKFDYKNVLVLKKNIF